MLRGSRRLVIVAFFALLCCAAIQVNARRPTGGHKRSGWHDAGVSVPQPQPQPEPEQWRPLQKSAGDAVIFPHVMSQPLDLPTDLPQPRPDLPDETGFGQDQPPIHPQDPDWQLPRAADQSRVASGNIDIDTPVPRPTPIKRDGDDDGAVPRPTPINRDGDDDGAVPRPTPINRDGGNDDEAAVPRPPPLKRVGAFFTPPPSPRFPIHRPTHRTHPVGPELPRTSPVGPEVPAMTSPVGPELPQSPLGGQESSNSKESTSSEQQQHHRLFGGVLHQFMQRLRDIARRRHHQEPEKAQPTPADLNDMSGATEPQLTVIDDMSPSAYSRPLASPLVQVRVASMFSDDDVSPPTTPSAEDAAELAPAPEGYESDIDEDEPAAPAAPAATEGGTTTPPAPASDDSSCSRSGGKGRHHRCGGGHGSDKSASESAKAAAKHASKLRKALLKLRSSVSSPSDLLHLRWELHRLESELGVASELQATGQLPGVPAYGGPSINDPIYAPIQNDATWNEQLDNDDNDDDNQQKNQHSGKHSKSSRRQRKEKRLAIIAAGVAVSLFVLTCAVCVVLKRKRVARRRIEREQQMHSLLPSYAPTAGQAVAQAQQVPQQQQQQQQQSYPNVPLAQPVYPPVQQPQQQQHYGYAQLTSAPVGLRVQ